MFDHVNFGVSDYAASKAFFLKALEALGVAVVSEGYALLYRIDDSLSSATMPMPNYALENGRADKQRAFGLFQWRRAAQRKRWPA